MRQFSLFLMALFLFGIGAIALPGCGGSNEATVAPRTDEEIEEYRRQAYGAEEEEDAASDEDEE